MENILCCIQISKTKRNKNKSKKQAKNEKEKMENVMNKSLYKLLTKFR